MSTEEVTKAFQNPKWLSFWNICGLLRIYEHLYDLTMLTYQAKMPIFRLKRRTYSSPIRISKKLTTYLFLENSGWSYT